MTQKGLQAIIFLLLQEKQEGGYDGHEQIVIRNPEVFNCYPQQIPTKGFSHLQNHTCLIPDNQAASYLPPILIVKQNSQLKDRRHSLSKDGLSRILLKLWKIEIWEAQKSRIGKVVYFSDDARDALKAWYHQRDPQKTFVFYAMGRDTLTYAGVRVMFCKYLQKANLSHKGYTLHCLRHTNNYPDTGGSCWATAL